MGVKASVGAVDDTTSGQYFDVTPAARSARRLVPLTLPDLAVDLTTDRGVFSMARVDPGTRYLLLDAPTPPAGSAAVLDLGCGYGPIAVALAMRAPTTDVWAVDVNERAVESDPRQRGAPRTRSSAGRHAGHGAGRAGVRRHLVEPTRAGRERRHCTRCSTQWLPRLRVGAHAYLVVQKNLGADSLQRWLTNQGWPTTRLSSRAGYRLLDVVREAA